jgi:hypothetical protein
VIVFAGYNTPQAEQQSPPLSRPELQLRLADGYFAPPHYEREDQLFRSENASGMATPAHRNRIVRRAAPRKPYDKFVYVPPA